MGMVVEMEGAVVGVHIYTIKTTFFIKVLIVFSNCKFTGKQRETVIRKINFVSMIECIN